MFIATIFYFLLSLWNSFDAYPQELYCLLTLRILGLFSPQNDFFDIKFQSHLVIQTIFNRTKKSDTYISQLAISQLHNCRCKNYC